MTLASIGLAILHTWGASAGLEAAVREAMLGQVLVLPPELSAAERDEIADLLVLFAGLPLHVAARATALPRDHLCLLTDPIDGELPPVLGSIVVAVHRRVPGRRRLDTSVALRRLRDAVVDAFGRHHSGTRLQRLASWAEPIADSPSLVLRFTSAALSRHLADERASDATLFAAGLAASVGWLLRGLDFRVAQWALAHALPARKPGHLVDTEAAILGEDRALQRAFEAGLVEALPEEPGDPIDLRRPLHLLGHPDERPVEVDLVTLARELRAVLAPEVYVVVDRLLGSVPKPLGLTGPLRPSVFVGRNEVLKRLRSLFEPAEMISPTVLYGILGSGRTAVASALCELIGGTLEPVWLTFVGGPSSGWVPVANALGMEIEDAEGSPVPRWVRQVHERLRERPCLLVVTDVDDVPEDELPGWLPSGAGQCAVLVLSRSAQRALQREHDAVTVPMRGLPLEESKELLAGKVPKLAEEIRGGEADGLLRRIDGNPGALLMAATLLEKNSLAEVETLAGHRDGPIRALVQKVVDGLDEEETRLVRALAVCAEEGSPQALPLGIAGVEAGVLARLADRALVVTRKGRVRLHGLIRLVERANLDEVHAEKAAELFGAARKTKDVEAEEGVYDDALLALERMTGRCRPGEERVAAIVGRLARGLCDYPRGNGAERLRRVIAGCQAALTVFTKEAAPAHWSDLQTMLGNALQSLSVGDRANNLRQAINAYRAALGVRTRESYPTPWAAAQNDLGNALVDLPIGDKSENLNQAIAAYRAVLTVWTKESYPEEWAIAQNNLGRALSDLPTGDRSDNLNQAIDAYRAALSVKTKESDPEAWAQTQTNMGAALQSLPNGDKAENLRHAIDAHRAALTVYERESYPAHWAAVQNNLGSALKNLPTGDKAANAQQAIHAYRAALTVRTKEASPWDWAQNQYNLGLALRVLPAGDRKQNLRDAIDALRDALTVYTPEAFPNDHPRMQASLEATLADLAALESQPPPPDP